MSAQELESLQAQLRWIEEAIRSYDRPGRGNHRIADKIAAIRDGLGKAQAPITFLCDGTRFKMSFSRNKRVDCFSHFADELDGKWVALVLADDDAHLKLQAPPSDSAQVLVEAGTNVLTGGNHIASLLIRRMGGGDWPKDGHEVIEKYGVETYDIWCCWKSIMEFRDALAANKSEVKG